MASEGNATGHCYPVFHDDTKCGGWGWFLLQVAILIVRTIIAVISMVCCLFIVGIIVLFKKYRFLSQRLILYLSISAFFQSVVYATANFYVSGKAARGIHTGLCVLQGYWTLFFDWLTFVLVLCISFNVFWTAVFLKKSASFEKFYVIISITVPIVITVFPFIGNSYGPAGLWCWISAARDGEVYVIGAVLQFVLFYCPLWLFSILMLLSLVVVAVVHRNRLKANKRLGTDTESQESIWRDEIRPILFFPLVYIAILIFPSINRLRLAGGFKEPESAANFFLWFMHSITLPLHGMLYAILFAFDKQTLSRIRWVNIKAAFIEWNQQSAVEYNVTENKFRETFRKKNKI